MESTIEPNALRMGASAGHPIQLPNIVYLRGDEDYFDDFTLGAEEAMGLLGIKRSRLTQISGRELRVGRLRMGRYIKPVFRPEDIEEYQSKTRPPATHQAAAQSLKSSVEGVISSITPLVEGNYEEIKEDLRRRMSKQSQLLKDDHQRLQCNLDHCRRELDRSLDLIQKLHVQLRKLSEMWQESQHRHSSHELVQESSFALVCQQLAENQVALKTLEIKQQKIQEAMAFCLEAMAAKSLHQAKPRRRVNLKARRCQLRFI